MLDILFVQCYNLLVLLINWHGNTNHARKVDTGNEKNTDNTDRCAADRLPGSRTDDGVPARRRCRHSRNQRRRHYCQCRLQPSDKGFRAEMLQVGRACLHPLGQRGRPVYHNDPNRVRLQPEQHIRLDVRLIVQL